MKSAARAIVLILSLTVVCQAAGQSKAKEPNVNVSTPDQVLEIKATDICKVDFRNSRIFGPWDQPVKLRGGRYEHKSRQAGDYELVSLDQVVCFADAGGTVRHVVLISSWTSCGGSCSNDGIVQLLSLRDGHPVNTQEFRWNADALGTGASFDKKSLTLKIIARSDDDTPNCCAVSLDAVVYGWKDSEFVQLTYKRIPALKK